ncbi:MAG: hypothetical protein ACI8RZ_006595 [Myxococcota bacterium]
MTQSDLILFSAIAVLAGNHAVLRIPGWSERMWLFWGIQALNLSAACYLIAFGIPEFRSNLAVANWMLGLLFIFHTVSNNRRFQRERGQRGRRSVKEDEVHQERIRAALKAGEEQNSD